MAAESSETVSLQEPHLQKQYQYQQALDPISLLLSHNLNYIMERGPRYRAYAELRESKLRSRNQSGGNEENQDPKLTPPPKKQVKFQVVMSNSTSSSSSSILAQSVPDFSSVLRRKDNRKPVIELTPPPPHSKVWSRSNVAGSNAKGSKSANAGEKKNRSGLMAARKSCVNLEELRGFSSNAINGGDDRGGHVRSSRLTGRNVFGFTRF